MSKTKLSEEQKEIINRMGKIKFTKLHIRFYNKVMCRTCKHKAIQLISKHKSKEVFDNICSKCQKAYSNMVEEASC